MNFLVTGGSGFLGQSVVKTLATKGYRGVFLDLQEPTDPDVKRMVDSGRWVFHRCDFSDPESWKPLPLNGPTYVIHLAGRVHTSTEITAGTKLEFQTACGLIPLLNGIGDNLVGVALASSIEVYGTPQTNPITEDHPTHPFNIYGIVKLVLEKLLTIYCKGRVPLTILRLSHIYGPGDIHPKAIPSFIRNALAGKASILVNGGLDERAFVYVEDAARAFVAAAETKAQGVFNIANEAHCIHYTLQMIEHLCGQYFDHTPRFGEKAALKYNVDISRARAVLGYEPATTFIDGLRKTVEWEKGRLKRDGEALAIV